MKTTINVNLHEATDRKTPCHWVTVGGVSMLFSYRTIMAFRGMGKCYRREDGISVTTRKHLHETGCADYPKLDDEAFQDTLQRALCEGIHPMLAPVAMLDEERES